MFCEILRKLTEETGKNQKEVAADIKLSQQRFNYYVIGKREPDIKTLIMMSNYFNVSVDFLLGNTNNKNPLTSLDISEYPVVIKYRELDNHGQELIDCLLDKEYERCKGKKPTVKIVAKNNDMMLSAQEDLKEATPLPDAMEVAHAYGCAPLKEKNMVRYTLDLKPLDADTKKPPHLPNMDNIRREAEALTETIQKQSKPTKI